ncbi:hypothetical protein MC885_020383, partial [Smutsia gigantea]
WQLFTDGITNKLIGCYVNNTMEDVVLVRIYGNKTELLVDRDEEVKSFRVLQAHGCAPQLYCTFNNGLCYEFIQGEALDPKHVCNPAIFRLIARQLAKIHAIHAHNGWIPKSNLWLKMGKYFSLIPTGFADEDINKSSLIMSILDTTTWHMILEIISMNLQASHFFWGLWALIQAKYSTIEFDFLGYAIVRFNQYFKMKPEVTALKV